jgi:hypothetical protein
MSKFQYTVLYEVYTDYTFFGLLSLSLYKILFILQNILSAEKFEKCSGDQ